MDKFKNENYWFIDILTNEKLKSEIQSKYTEYGTGKSIYRILQNYFKENLMIEGVDGTYDRV